jgi:hypothetical protein
MRFGPNVGLIDLNLVRRGLPVPRLLLDNQDALRLQRLGGKAQNHDRTPMEQLKLHFLSSF